jgi:DNA adenine methylase
MSKYSNIIIRSPFFYVGDKFKLIAEIKQYFPKDINKYIEPFVGGGSAFMNVKAKEYYLNDIDTHVIKLHKYLTKQANNPNVFFKELNSTLRQYNLSYSYKEDIIPSSLKNEFKKTYFARYNKNGYLKLREEFNSKKKENMLFLYILLIYGFNRMLRFNNDNKFNLPVGNVDFNSNVEKALYDYFNIVKNINIKWFNLDYGTFIKNINLNNNDFLYLDPPYLITKSEYNKLWNAKEEIKLLELLTDLNKKHIKFAISNITNYNNKENNLFIDWSKSYNIHNIQSNYINYHNNSKKEIKEVLVTNY